MGSFLTKDGLKSVLGYIKEKYAREGHTHNEKEDIVNCGLHSVAFSGSYNDLEDTPSLTPNIPDATESSAGVVKPGSGLIVGPQGKLNVNVDESATGIYVNSNNKIDIKFGKGVIFYDGKWTSTIHIEDGWNQLYAKMKGFIKSYNSNDIVGIDMVLRNDSAVDKEFVIKLTPDIITNIKNNTTYNFINSNVENIEEYTFENCTLPVDVLAYETLKILSDNNGVDAIGLYLFKKMLNNGNDKVQMVTNLRRLAPFSVTVDEYDTTRLDKLKFEIDNSFLVSQTYVLRNSENGWTYVPLTKII